MRAALGGHVCVWCEVDEETAWERASRDSERPLAADRDQFARRFAARAPLYEGLARAILPANARDAAAEAAPWIAALRALPGMRMIWASSASGSYPALIGEGAAGALDAARAALPGELPERSFLIADPVRPGCPRGAAGRRGRDDRGRRRRGIEDDGRGRAGAGRARRGRRPPRRPRGRARRRSRRGPRRLLRRHLPARGPGGPGPDDAGRAGGLRLRRQDRGGPARRQELRRRLPPAARRPRRPRGARDAAARRDGGGLRRGREDGAARRRGAVGARALAGRASTRPRWET